MGKVSRKSSQSSQLSRPSQGGFAIGKCTATAKTLLPEQLKEDFSRKWRNAGYAGEGECLRDLIAMWTYGKRHVQSMMQSRLEALSAIGTESDR